MGWYTLSLLRDGKPAGHVKCHHGDDLDVVDTAILLCRDYEVEVSAESRLVARIKQGEQPL